MRSPCPALESTQGPRTGSRQRRQWFDIDVRGTRRRLAGWPQQCLASGRCPGKARESSGAERSRNPRRSARIVPRTAASGRWTWRGLQEVSFLIEAPTEVTSAGQTAQASDRLKRFLHANRVRDSAHRVHRGSARHPFVLDSTSVQWRSQTLDVITSGRTM